MPNSFCFPPVEYCDGTKPNQAAKPRPFLNSAPLPIAETIAVAVRGPMPDRLQTLAGFILAGRPQDDRVDFVDLILEMLHLPPQLC
jgi:hypothetical protein